jgi:hypothetical protein
VQGLGIVQAAIQGGTHKQKGPAESLLPGP